MGKIHKWRFGDYAVVASKQGWTRTGTHSNLFKTKTESRSVNEFSFVLSNNTTDSAFVDAGDQAVIPLDGLLVIVRRGHLHFPAAVAFRLLDERGHGVVIPRSSGLGR